MGAKKRSLEERLQRHGRAREVSDALGKGIDRLPVNELTRTMLKYKSRELAVTLAETGTALSAAARDGAETFQQTRAQERRPDGGHEAQQAAARGGGAGDRSAPAASTDDVSARLERLAALHADGHLDDREYLAAKAKVLGLDT